MRLIDIDIVNFKKLRQFRATFQEGLNVIVGDNAAGKTTLLQAIECALYGPGVVPGRKDMIPTWGQTTWKLVLTFRLDGTDYVLTRSKSTARLARQLPDDEELVANGHTSVNAAVAELIGLTAKDYNLFLQSQQGQTAGVLTFGAAALNRKVEEYSGVALIDRVQSLAQEEARTHKAQAEALAVPAEALEAAGEQVTALADAALDAEASMHKAQEALDALPTPESLAEPDVDPDALQARRERILSLRGQHERAVQELAHALQRRDAAQQRFDEVTAPAEAADLEAEAEALGRRVKDAASEVGRLQRALSEQAHRWDEFLKAQSRLNGHPSEADIRDALDDEANTRAELHDRRRAEGQHVAMLDQQIRQRQALAKDALCPTCGTRLSEHDPQALADEIDALAARRDTHERAETELARACRAADEQVRQLEAGLAASEAHAARVTALRAALEADGVDLTTGESPVESQLVVARETHEGLVGEKATLDHQREQLAAEQRRYRRLAASVTTEREYVEQAREALADLEHRLAEAEADGLPDESAIDAARQAWRKYLDDKSALGLKRRDAYHAVTLAKQSFEQAQKDLGRARGDVTALETRRGEASQAEKAADQAGRLARFLRERRAGYLQEVWDAVLAAASRQVAMASKGMVSRLVYADGDFLFEEEGILAPVTSASGAQLGHIGVAVRIGLSRALYGSGALLIFDEPTEAMREHHAAGLAASLAGAAAQCLLITHREQDQDLAAHVVEVGA